MGGNNGAIDVGSYDKWNDGIFNFFFGPEKAGRSIRLAFDDATIDRVAMALGVPGTDFLDEVAGVLRPDASDPFIKFIELAKRDRPIPSTIGLLAAQVLVASRMHADAKYSTSAFWPRFNQMLFRRESVQTPHNVAILGQFWRSLADWLNVVRSGELGVLRIPEHPEDTPLHGWKHVNYPLSQCMIREVDRLDLIEYFFENARARECPVNRIVSIVAESQYAFGKTFASVLRQALSSESFGDELGRAIAEIRSQVPLLPGVSPTAALRRIARSRLKITKYRGDVIVVLQHHGDHWEDVVQLDAGEWRDGLSDDRGTVLWPGADYTVFIEGPDGFVTSKEPVKTGVRVRLLCTVEMCDAFLPEIDSADFLEIDLAGALDGLRCLQFSADVERDDALLERLGLKAGIRLAIRLNGGLDIGSRRFVSGAAPRVVIENAGGARVTINGHACKIDDDGRVFRDSTPNEPGRYIVEAGDASITFDIVNLSDSNDSEDGSCIGYALSAAPAIMIVKDLLEEKRDELNSARTLVGAELQ